MLIQMRISDAIKDFEWVVRVLESAETRTQMKSVMSCFNLWELKYRRDKFTEVEDKTIRALKSNYWSLYKNKNLTLLKN
jgi:hypothetical protein